MEAAGVPYAMTGQVTVSSAYQHITATSPSLALQLIVQMNTK